MPLFFCDLKEISYGQLLIPSRQFMKEKKLQAGDNDIVDLGYVAPNKHHMVSRYLKLLKITLEL